LDAHFRNIIVRNVPIKKGYERLEGLMLEIEKTITMHN